MKTKRVRQPKNEPRLLKEHEAAYRALLDLLIRQVEREVREEYEALAKQAETARAEAEDEKGGT
jgi:hypothetical protein